MLRSPLLCQPEPLPVTRTKHPASPSTFPPLLYTAPPLVMVNELLKTSTPTVRFPLICHTEPVSVTNAESPLSASKYALLQYTAAPPETINPEPPPPILPMARLPFMCHTEPGSVTATM